MDAFMYGCLRVYVRTQATKQQPTRQELNEQNEPRIEQQLHLCMRGNGGSPAAHTTQPPSPVFILLKRGLPRERNKTKCVSLLLLLLISTCVCVHSSSSFSPSCTHILARTLLHPAPSASPRFDVCACCCFVLFVVSLDAFLGCLGLTTLVRGVCCCVLSFSCLLFDVCVGSRGWLLLLFSF